MVLRPRSIQKKLRSRGPFRISRWQPDAHRRSGVGLLDNEASIDVILGDVGLAIELIEEGWDYSVAVCYFEFWCSAATGLWLGCG